MAQVILDILNAAEQEVIDSGSDQYSCLLHTRMMENYSPYLKELPYQSSYAILHDVERCFLHLLSKSLPKESIYAEVGSWLGGSACIVANANPNISINCYDPFYDATPTKFQQGYYDNIIGTSQPRTLIAVQEIVRPFPNINLYPVISPDGIETTDIDVYFEDGDHCNPGLEKNLNFWMPKVKEGGLMIIHDYRPWARGSNIIDRDGTNIFWNDVYNHVEELRKNTDWKFLGFVYSMAVFKRRKNRA
jgi:hypothetical protein